MPERANKREKRLAMLVVAAVVVVTVLLIVETFRLLLPGLWTVFSAGDEQALSDYLTSQGRLRSFLTLWFLAVVQVLSLVIPAMPVQLAAGLAYGPWLGFLTSFSASAVANMSVYLLARRLAPVIRRLVADNPKAAKLLDSVRSSKDPWFYTILAFITPGLPNGIIPYAAANAGMRPKQFLAAIFISLPFPTLLTCAAGSFILEGNWLLTVLVGVVLFSFVGILFFNRTRLIARAHQLNDNRKKKPGHESLGFFIKVSPKGEGIALYSALHKHHLHQHHIQRRACGDAQQCILLPQMQTYHRSGGNKFRQAMGRAEQVHAAQAVDHQHRHDGAGQHTREVDNKPWCGPPAAEHHKGQKPYQRRHARDHRHKQRTVYIKRHGRPPFSR